MCSWEEITLSTCYLEMVSHPGRSVISKSAVRGGRVILESGAWPELGRLCGLGRRGGRSQSRKCGRPSPAPPRLVCPQLTLGSGPQLSVRASVLAHPDLPLAALRTRYAALRQLFNFSESFPFPVKLRRMRTFLPESTSKWTMNYSVEVPRHHIPAKGC